MRNVPFVVKETGEISVGEGRFTTYPTGIRLLTAFIWLGGGLGERCFSLWFLCCT